ncbi:MAG: anthranilate phosphoribosyltransferase [Alphaproteobacteria bacterium]
MLNETLEKVARRENLTRDEMAAAIGTIVEGACSTAQMAGLLLGLRVKGEAVDELLGAAAALRSRAVKLPSMSRPDLDTVGTGGDGSGSLNLSTAAALVAAGAGLKVAKHGNRSVSSKCGSADVLTALGVPTEMPPADTARAIEATGFGFLFAPLYHPAMKQVAPVRRDLGVRTLFNLLGPLTNPADVRTQLVGVYHPSRLELLASALAEAGVERALVVSAPVGLDEIAPCGETHVIEVEGGSQRRYTITPDDFDLAPQPLASIRGGDPTLNARLLIDVLSGHQVPARTAVLLNAAAGLFAAGAAKDFRDGARQAAYVIDSGRALAALDAARASAQGLAA